MGVHDAKNLAKLLSGKLHALPPAALAEVAAFIEAVSARAEAAPDDHGLTRAAMAASIPSLTSIWNNPEDDVYDAL